jgi:proteasome lid subunit RPN8/RPN11
LNAETAHFNTKISPSGTRVILSRQWVELIHDHSSSAYPEECCGLLLGRFEDAGENDSKTKTKLVVYVKRMENVFASEERYHRYTIDPSEFLKAEIEAESLGLEIVGIYHSHPNAAAKPSEFDKNHAWPSLSYVVVEVRDSKPIETKSWVLKEDRTEFLQEDLIVKDSD